jgi:hypothetical protein
VERRISDQKVRIQTFRRLLWHIQNATQMPELESQYGYVGVWILIGVTVAAVIVWFQRSGWTR